MIATGDNVLFPTDHSYRRMGRKTSTRWRAARKGEKGTWRAWDRPNGAGYWAKDSARLNPVQWTERAPIMSHPPSLHVIPENTPSALDDHPWGPWGEHYSTHDALPLYPVFAQEVWNTNTLNVQGDQRCARRPILIDSGASSTVFGRDWRPPHGTPR